MPEQADVGAADQEGQNNKGDRPESHDDDTGGCSDAECLSMAHTKDSTVKE